MNTTDSIKFYFDGTRRFVMRAWMQSVKYLLGDHLGSTSMVLAGERVAEGQKGSKSPREKGNKWVIILLILKLK